MSALPLLALAAAAAAQTFDPSGAVQDLSRTAAARPAVIVDAGSIGSWYRKIASTDGTDYDGISASGVMPFPAFDPARMHRASSGEAAYTEGPLDNPGVYIGAHAQGREVDAGYKWDHRYDAQGRDTGEFAWRLFWRVAAPAGHTWRNPPIGSAQDVYLKPGEPFTLTLTVLPGGMARFDAGDVTVAFPLNGFFDGARRLPRRFKRVHAIDQFRVGPDGSRKGNEGSVAVPTRATLEGGRWDSVELFGPDRVPLTGRRAIEWRGGDCADSYADVFTNAAPNAAGGEPIVVHPRRP